jgi:fructan beta-fructosidase
MSAVDAASFIRSHCLKTMNKSLVILALLVAPLTQSVFAAPVAAVPTTTRDILITKTYLRFPVKNGAPAFHLTLSVDGQPEPAIPISLTDTAPDWWAWKDVSAWKGKTVTITSTKPAPLTAIEQADKNATPADLYHEVLRPQFHFTSQQGWLNDPNGLVYYKGEYHLFYQHNPYGWTGGYQNWGHAISTDLVHWKELGDAIYADPTGLVWSGSGIVDWKNTGGVGKPGEAPLILFYTAAGSQFTQGMAYSSDGRTFTKFNGNPVVKQIVHENRDPKVIWYEPTHCWVMVLYAGFPTGEMTKKGKPKLNDTIQFLNSTNLKNWTVTSQIPSFHECPDFFELPVDGDPQNKKWVLTAADSGYMVGTFDGKTFTPETPKIPGSAGRTSYAAQTFSDTPDGRRIHIGWMRAPSPGMAFNQEMSVPIELKLVTTPDGPRLTWTPVKELESLRGPAQHLGPLTLKPGDTNPLTKVHGELLEIRARFNPGDAKDVSFNVRGASVLYDATTQEITVNGVQDKAPLHNGEQDLTIYLDRTSIEVFGSQGLTYIPKDYIPDSKDESVEVRATGGEAKFTSIDVFPLTSAWK